MTKGISFGIVLWCLIEIPTLFLLVDYLNKHEAQITGGRRVAVQSVLKELFEQSARFGDSVNARGVVTRFGSSFGLASLGVCVAGADINPSPDNDQRCNLSRVKGESVTAVSLPSGQVDLQFNWHPQAQSNSIFLIALVTSVLLTLALVMIVVVAISRFFSTIIINLSNKITKAETSELIDSLSGELIEIKPLAVAINQMRIQLVKSVEENSRLQHQAQLGALAGQVSHDIRSPLSALDAMLARLDQLPENDRLIIRGAINRIKDIAQNLLEQNRRLGLQKHNASSTSLGEATEATTVALLSSVIDPLITEKRMQFRSKIGVEIDAKIDSTSYGLFASIQLIEFKRLISNLINNAVEVLGDNGSVSITLRSVNQEIEMTVRDNGKGIPPEILARLGNRGETHGKAGGSGLGLYHARTSVESWGGKLRIESAVGKGTSVIISLPQAQVPGWFVAALKLNPGSTVVVLDDDNSIHQIWQGRFEALQMSDKQISLVHLSTPDQLRSWVRDNAALAQHALYLADFELLGFKETGLSLIEELTLGSRSILVTSRFEEHQIMKDCLRLSVRMIPKGMAGFVPILINQPTALVDAILIDDDSLVHLVWQMAATGAGKKLAAFIHPDSFLEIAESFNKSSPVYVDASLSHGIKGEVVAKKIHDLGFKRVYIATGWAPEKFQELSFLAGVLGKDAPF